MRISPVDGHAIKIETKSRSALPRAFAVGISIGSVSVVASRAGAVARLLAFKKRSISTTVTPLVAAIESMTSRRRMPSSDPSPSETSFVNMVSIVR